MKLSRTIFFLLALLTAAWPARAQNALQQALAALPPTDTDTRVSVTAEFDPPLVAVGATSTCRITVTAPETAVVWPAKLSLPQGLRWQPAARGQMLQFVNGKVRPLTALNFTVSADQPGYFGLPTFSLTVNGTQILLPETFLQVVAPGDPTPRPPARQLLLRPAHREVFIGETFTVQTIMPATGTNGISGLTQLQFNGGGFIEDKSQSRQTIRPTHLDGQNVMAYVAESALVAIAAGPQPLAVQGFTANALNSGPIIITGNVTIPGRQTHESQLLESAPVTIQVRPLPTEDRLPGFTGHLGELLPLPPRASTNTLPVGDALQLIVTFTSDQQLSRFTPPPAPRAADWQTFPPEPVATPPDQNLPGRFTASFAYPMIPLTPTARATPAIPCSTFDRQKEIYVDRTIPAVAVTVTGSEPPADWRAQNFSADDGMERLALSPLAAKPGKTCGSLVPLVLRPGFALAQLLPAAALAALWWRDRRRRFLAAHPEIVRRRQARRDLRRIRRARCRAVIAADEQAFVSHAIAALQIAAAPHFPATPRALVKGEVLSVLPEAERTGRSGEVIRQFFAQAEAADFSVATAASAAPLLALAPELETILQQMEARL